MRITRANSKAVEYACKNFHYAKTVPSVSIAYNIYNDSDEWCGTIVYGVGANNFVTRAFDKNTGEVLELERVALNGKQEQTSKAVAMSLRQLHKDIPLCKIVVSYSDHRQKHLGTIYQATNWIYIGTVTPNDDQYFLNGRWTHARTISHQQNREELRKILPKRKNSSKFKYIFCFDKKERKEYMKLALPYPKDEDLLACDGQVEERVKSKGA